MNPFDRLEGITHARRMVSIGDRESVHWSSRKLVTFKVQCIESFNHTYNEWVYGYSINELERVLNSIDQHAHLEEETLQIKNESNKSRRL